MKLNLLKLLFAIVILRQTYCFDINDFNPFRNGQQTKEQIYQFFLGFGVKWIPTVQVGEYPYFNFFPQYQFHIKPTDRTKTTQGRCFKELNFSIEREEKKLIVNIKGSKSINFYCSELLLLTTLNQFEIISLSTRLGSSVVFEIPNSESLVYDLFDRGIAVFVFPQTIKDVITNLIRTIQFFTSEMLTHIPSYYEQLNLDFIRKYVGFNPQIRPIRKVEIPANMIRSGDLILVNRYNGLGPMIMWMGGSGFSHCSVAVRIKGELHICESNTDGADWPINGIQCNPYDFWLKEAEKSEYLVTWLPLDRSIQFDDEEAVKFINPILGVDYGYEVMFMGYIDTLMDNYPCRRKQGFTGPSENICVEPQILEYAFSALTRKSPGMARVWTQTLSKRVGMSSDSKLEDIYYEAHKRGISSLELPAIPEKDDWEYETTKYGQPVTSRISVCNQFVCQVLRAGGVFKKFGNLTFECNEFTIYDMLKIKIYQDNFLRPKQCIDADPQNNYCQLLGKYTMNVDKLAGKNQVFNKLNPVDHMGEKCPLLEPFYESEPNC